MKKQFLVVKGDPDELSPYSHQNVVEMECGESTPPSMFEGAMKERLEKEMAEVLRGVIEIETNERPKYPIVLSLVDEFATDRLIPRTEEELVELAEAR